MTKEELFEEILVARERVYAVGEKTPMHVLPLSGVGAEVWVKREDLGPIKAYKWRGAYNAMAALTPEQRACGIVAASAGNHAQGIALAARSLGCRATIFMPRSTPEVKQREVLRHGGGQGGAVEIRLVGDTYDDAGIAATKFCEETGGVYVHPYNAPTTMGGQGTLADEIVMSGQGPFDRVYIAIGGGGLVSAVACWLKKFWPKCQVIGVEGVDQASMKAALEAGAPTELSYLDVFCDGTAVRKVGDKTFGICQQLLDGIVTVSNEEVSEAIRLLWEAQRVIPEPSGAMGLAAIVKDYEAGKIKDSEKVLTIVCGANMDFAQLGNIARQAGSRQVGNSQTGEGSKHRRFLRVEIPEGKGTLLHFLEQLPSQVSIVDLQYGRLDSAYQYPVLGLLGTAEDYQRLDEELASRGIKRQDVSADDVVNFRIINYQPELFQNPLFTNIEFPERPGAFLEFMSQVQEYASLCYFNYSYSGERVGRALVGMEFHTQEDKEACQKVIESMVGGSIRAVRSVSENMLENLGVSASAMNL